MWIAPVVVFAVLGALAIPFPQLLGNGKDVVQQVFIAPGGIGLLLALVVLKPLVTAACLGSGAPGGLFTRLAVLELSDPLPRALPWRKLLVRHATGAEESDHDRFPGKPSPPEHLRDHRL
jgi:hypothetical protein